jgi:hypothetical protein
MSLVEMFGPKPVRFRLARARDVTGIVENEIEGPARF